MKVFVLLYNARTENEGIHTLRLSAPNGSQHNIVMMFESEDDATRYAILLEAQDFMTPTVEGMESEDIEEFCEQAGYGCKLIPEGFVPKSAAERVFLAPPETNLDRTDWTPEGKSEPTEAESEYAETELDDIRRRLENLL